MPDFSNGAGSGNPYYGSGFMNFDRFLNEQNVNWGNSVDQEFISDGDWTNQHALDNWMIRAGHVQPTVTRPPIQELPTPQRPPSPNPNHGVPDEEPTPQSPWFMTYNPHGVNPPQQRPGGGGSNGIGVNQNKPDKGIRNKDKEDNFPSFGSYLSAW